MSNKVDVLKTEGASKPRSKSASMVRDKPKDVPKEDKFHRNKKKAEEKEATSPYNQITPDPRPKSAPKPKTRVHSNAVDTEQSDPTLQEWQRDHIVALINSSPFPSYAKCVRMSSAPPKSEHVEKEPKAKEVKPKQVKPKEIKVKETTRKDNTVEKPKEAQKKVIKTKTQSTQCLPIQTRSHHIQVTPPRATKALQTTGLYLSKREDEDAATPDPNHNNESNISNSDVTEMSENINAIYYIVKDIEEKTDTLKEKEDEILAACQDSSQGGEPCQGAHIDESVIKEIPEQLNVIHELVKGKLGNEADPQNIVVYLEQRLIKIQEDLRYLKEDRGNYSSVPPPKEELETYSQAPPPVATADDERDEREENLDAYMGNVENIIRIGHRNTNSYIQKLGKAIKDLKDTAEMINSERQMAQPEVVHASEDPNSERILFTVERVYDMLNESPREQSSPIPVQQEASIAQPKDPYMGDCRCDLLRNGIPKQRNNVNHTARGFNESLDLCQRCINDYRGRVFVNIRNLPPSSNENLTHVLGQMIECLEHDNHSQLSQFLDSFTEQAQDWTDNDHTNAYLGLFRISLGWNNIRCPLTLSNYLNVDTLIENEFGSRIKYQQSAFDVLGQLLCGFDPALQKAYITGPTLCGSLFDAIGTGNVIAFNFLVCKNAPLDEIKEGRSVLHEIVFQAHKHGGVEEEKSWHESLLKMLDIFYKHARSWWECQGGGELIATGEDSASENESVCSESSPASSVHGSPMRSHQMDVIGEEFNINALRYLLSITDTKGRNPLQYASEYGPVDIVKKILSEPPYQFLPDPFDFPYDAHNVGYVVEDIDGSIAGKGVSALDRILMRPPKEASKMLAIEPFKSMISDRWHRFYVFGWLWVLIYLYYMCVYTACVIHRPTNRSSLSAMYNTDTDVARLIGEIFIVLGLFWFIYGEVRDLVRLGWVWPWPWTFNGLSRLINFLFFILTICAVGVRFSINENEDVVLSLALVTGWLNAIYFLVMIRGARLIPYILHTIFIQDFCRRFSILFILALTATSTATYCTYQQANRRIPGVNVENLWDTPFLLYQLYFGLGTTDHVPESRNTGIGYTLFIFHIWLFGFILMNLLIAMIIHTYMIIKRDEESLCRWLKAWMVQLLDRRLLPCLLVSYGSDRTCIGRCRSGRLKYRLRGSLRKNAEGKVAVVKEHVVLVSQDE